MKKALPIFTVVIVFIALIFYWHTRNKKPEQVDGPSRDMAVVSVVPVRSVEFTDIVGYVANLEPVSQAAVVPKVSGKTVIGVLVQEGDRVKKGDVLARADDSLVKQDISRSREAVNIAATSYGTAEKDYIRMKELYSENVISKQAFEHAEAQFDASRSRLKEARSSLAQLEIMLSYHTVTAPVGGVVSKRFIDPGDTLSQQAAFLIYKQDILEASGNIPARVFTGIKVGQKAIVKVDALPGKVFEGNVSRVSPIINPSTRTGEVIVNIACEDILKPGMFARVEITIGKHEGLALPGDVVRRVTGTGNFRVYLLRDNIAEETIVTLGVREGNLVEVIEGLTPQDKVISSLSSQVRDGAPVEVRVD